MPPSSLANHLAFKERSRQLRPVPAHRRFAAVVARLSRRARALLAVALVLLLWRWADPRIAQRSATTQSATTSRTHAPTSEKGVRFAPTQLRPPSARVYFANGAVQEVFAARPTRPQGDGRAYERLWEASEVVRAEIPLGAKLRWMDWEGGEGVLERGRGDDCAEGPCEDVSHVRLELDIRTGLRQLRDTDPAQSLTFEVPSRAPVAPTDVTLVTQLSVSRLDRFERMLDAWDGPLSAAIYLVDETDVATLEAYFASPELPPAWDRVSLAVVKADYSISEEALLSRLRYPINRLRNLALSLAPSPYTLVVDVDFVPSPDMHSILSSRGVPLIERPSSRNSRSPTLRRTAVVIPTFALSAAFDGAYPNSTSELEALFTADPPIASLTDVNAGHGPTLPSLLFSDTPALHDAAIGTLDPAASYEVCYEPQWEPYYLLARASHPLYDERFTDQGGDKQAHALVLNALGFGFRALRDVWVVHPPKTDPAAEAWPAARLVQREGRPEHAAADEDDGAAEGGEHFNLAAQRDESRFRYFQDFLPEMERVWGKNVRWPRGCDARVVGPRSFGRARAGTAFGL
ncbi:hypothetical protein JCM10450v2_003228 [Rhodotorula kratochvilovae]